MEFYPVLQKHPVTQPLKSPRWNQKDRCWHASGNDRQCLSSPCYIVTKPSFLNMCWGAGLPSSGKLAEDVRRLRRLRRLLLHSTNSIKGRPPKPPYPPRALRGLSEGSCRRGRPRKLEISIYKRIR